MSPTRSLIVASFSYIWIWLTGWLCSFFPRITWVANSISFGPSKYSELNLVEVLERLFYKWDAVNYLDIGLNGYGGTLWKHAFFPLYPYLLRVISQTTLVSDPQTLGRIASLVQVPLFAVALYFWSRIIPNRKDWVWVLAFYPTSVFFFAAYPETLFIALGGVICFSLLHSRQVLLLTAIPLLMLTKHAGVGMALAAPLWCLIYRRKLLLTASFAWIAGLIGVLSFYKMEAGDPWIWLKAQQLWGRSFGFPWHLIHDLQGKGIELILYVVLLFAAPILLGFKALGAQTIRARESWTLCFLWVSALFVPVWFGSSTASLYRIIALGTPCLALFEDAFSWNRGFVRRAFVVFVILLNLHATYRFVAYLQLA